MEVWPDSRKGKSKKYFITLDVALSFSLPSLKKNGSQTEMFDTLETQSRVSLAIGPGRFNSIQ